MRVVRQVLVAGLALVAGILTPGLPARVVADAFGPPVMVSQGYPPLRIYPEQVRAASGLQQPPSVSAHAALLVDLDSGQTLYSLRPNDPLPPASTVKIMTALVVLRRSRLDEMVTVSRSAADAAGSRMGLVAGEALTVKDLLYGLLLPSGNDAATALAEYVGGSEAGFVALMNETAAELGLAQTHFTNAHGLDDPAQMASAKDLMSLTKAALEYPAFATIVASPTAQVAGRTLTNTNQLLSTYPGVNGIKTGTTDAAGECLVASLMQGDHRLLAVLFGSQDRYADGEALLDYARAGWQWRTLDLADNALAWEVGPDGQRYRLRTARTSDVFLPAWQWPLAQPVSVLSSTVPLTGTAPAGALRLTLGEQVLAEVPLTVWQGP
jgi:D-alanyl-D-alanine carboxypeptidase (penicillin-binding protein 5/6)